ncbi:MAG: cell division protein FtsW [Parcubacteria group bacterium]|nr:cell division protein FtsW [Parcubacteria group bacterium]
MQRHFDTWFLVLVIALVVGGFFVFLSASLGLLARSDAVFSGIIINQIVSLTLGVGVLVLMARIPYRFLKPAAFYIFLLAIGATALVFIPSLGLAYGGAQRWLAVGPFTFQPAEFLKLGFVLYFAAWLSAMRMRVHSLWYGIVPFAAIIGVVGVLLLAQPDTSTFVIVIGTGLGMFLASGARWRHILALSGAAFAGLGGVAFWKPYIQQRIITFFDPSFDPLGAGYQIQQSLIAIGSGQLWGRGFGQSVQKFGFLPEPVGDSIFAVFAEEFGFFGSAALVTLFVLFAFRGFSIAARAPDYFARLTVVGLVILIVGQAFLNIGAMLAVFPLTGLPLPFVSHGGSALLLTLAEAGIILNISRYVKT